MPSDIDRARRWRVAFVALFVCMLAGAVGLGFMAVGGPGFLFYVVGPVVAALLGFDLWIKVRYAKSRRIAEMQEQSP
jgi:hypothetical protein